VIAADCRAPDCVWRTAAPSTPAGLRDVADRIRVHCREKHPRACREFRVVIHAAGADCDHEHVA